MPLSTAQQPPADAILARVETPRFLAAFTRGVDLARSGRQADAHTDRAWHGVLGSLGVERLAIVSQVHGDRIVEATRGPGPGAPLAEADAVFTRVPALAVAVRVADCVPVLLAGPGVVAAVHAGWRGVAARIVPKAVARLATEVGCAPSELHAVVGPAICGRHYEVGEEVVRALTDAGIPRRCAVVPGRGARAHVDGASAVAWQLADAGVEEITHVRACTWEHPELPSWRRDGKAAGRMAGIIVAGPM